MRMLALMLLPALGYCADHPAPGTKIVHFGELDPGVYKGSKPKNEADYRFLESKHVKYVLDLNFMPVFTLQERRMARKHGIRFIRVPMNASPLPPSEKHVTEALRYLRDERYHPIYFHCELGRDRTGMVAALYELYFHHLSQQEAWDRMKSYGYKDWFGIHGLKSYFEKHPNPPPGLEANGSHRLH